MIFTIFWLDSFLKGQFSPHIPTQLQLFTLTDLYRHCMCANIAIFGSSGHFTLHATRHFILQNSTLTSPPTKRRWRQKSLCFKTHKIKHPPCHERRGFSCSLQNYFVVLRYKVLVFPDLYTERRETQRGDFNSRMKNTTKFYFVAKERRCRRHLQRAEKKNLNIKQVVKVGSRRSA